MAAVCQESSLPKKQPQLWRANRTPQALRGSSPSSCHRRSFRSQSRSLRQHLRRARRRRPKTSYRPGCHACARNSTGWINYSRLPLTPKRSRNSPTLPSACRIRSENYPAALCQVHAGQLPSHPPALDQHPGRRPHLSRDSLPSHRPCRR